MEGGDFVLWGLSSDSSDESSVQSDDHNSYVTDDDFFNKVLAESTSIAQILNVHTDVALLLLQSVFWSQEKLISEFATNRAELLEKAAIPESDISKPQCLKNCASSGEMECPVCFSRYPAGQFLSLPCGHFFCKSCWITHMKTCIESNALPIGCMEFKCKRKVLLSDVSLLCGQKLARLLRNHISALSILGSGVVRRCTNPACKFSLSVSSVGLCNVARCKCGERICWLCGEEAHAPLHCSYVNKWMLQYSQGINSSTIHQRTKPCPKCKARIEKNGGCNHMACPNCHYEFCWICGEKWQTHKGDAYKCNAYVDYDQDSGISSNGRRLEHYCDRFQEHADAEKIEKNNKSIIREKMIGVFNSKSYPKHEEMIEHIACVLNEARSVLKWSYPHAFLMEEKSAELKLFEFAQANAEKALEKLSFSLEVTKSPNASYILKVAKKAEKCIDALLRQVDKC